MTFLEAINRIFRAEGILRGDTDPVTSFSDLQHGATIQLAQIAVQDELMELVSDQLIPYEKKTTGSIATVASTRTYALPSDFVRFYGTAMLFDSAGNQQLFEYRGGEDALRLMSFKYATDTGTPQYWYFDNTTTKKIGFWLVPQDAVTYTFDYEGDVSVTLATDTLPFHNTIEGQAFSRLAARRFKMLFEGMDAAKIANDPERVGAKATLTNLIVGTNPGRNWAPRYR